MTEDMNENVVLPCTDGFLTAEELVDLRKPGNEPVKLLVGDKFSTQTSSWIEEEAVKCSLANLKDVLSQKRASRQCDLIQAKWDEDQNIALATKLKGKYVQHMGHTVDGKIALSPEESMFLLENGAIEIMNGEAPMSTEEGFAVILKGKLSIEKYRVYSHLSQLGFIVVPHQKGLAVTRYEMAMNLDKHPVKKRKGSPIESQENKKKRLTFSGALRDDPKPSTSFNDSDIQVEDTLPVQSEVFENEKELEVCEKGGTSEITTAASIEDVAIDTSAQEVCENDCISEITTTTSIEDVAVDTSAEEVCENGGISEITTAASIEDVAADTSAQEVCANGGISEITTAASIEDVAADTSAQEVCANGDISEITSASIEDVAVDTSAQETSVNENIALENEVIDRTSLDRSSAAESNSQEVDFLQNKVEDVIVCQNKETKEADKREVISSSIGKEEANVDENCSSERNSYCEVMDDEEEEEVEMDQQIEVEDEIEKLCDTHNSVSCSEFQSTSEHRNVERQLEIDSQMVPEASPTNEIDVMDVDSQDTEISYNFSETSRDDVNGNPYMNTGSQNSCTIIDSHIKVNNVNGYSNSHEVNNCSSPFSCRSEPLLDADYSRGSILSESEHEDDDITLIEVTKKETKPLAVIDLLSCGEESSEPEPSDSDEEISILKVCSAPSASRDKRTQAGEVNSRKLNGFKKEELGSLQIPKFQIPALRVPFPDLYQKGVVCVARPPLHLLPNHVNPSKEAYILDLNVRNGHQQPSQGRVWDSYKTIQEYQRSRHMNHSFYEFQNRDNQERQHGMTRPHPDMCQDPTNRQTSLLGSSSTGMYGNNSWERNPPSRFPPTFPMPNPHIMNSMFSIRQQHMSMIRNQNQTFPQGLGFPPNVRIPNVANMGVHDIMSEVQKTAFAVARSMLSYMFNQPMGGQPMPPFNPFMNANGHASGPSSHTTPFNTYSHPPVGNNGYPDSMANDRRGFVAPQRRHTGRPFPCHFRRAGNKQSWETVKEAVGVNESDDNEVEEVPMTSTEVLWDPAVLHPLVKSGVRHEKSVVLNSLQKTQMAKLNKCSLTNKCFEESCTLEVAFDVYLPGCNYRKTRPSIPKHRVIVVKASDPIPRFAELAYIQRKWNDGASLQIAFVDHGDVSFMSFSSVTLPSLIPNSPEK